MAAPTILETRILIVDPDEALGTKLKSAFTSLGKKPDADFPAPVWGSNLRECQRFLSDREYAYVAVFVNPKVGSPSWVACIKACIQYRPGVPCYVIYDVAPTLSADQKKQLGVAGYLALPLDYEALRKVIKGEVQVSKNIEADPSPAPTPTARKEPTAPALTEKDFLAIKLQEQHGNAISLFDLYIKVNEGKFVQILKAGDRLTPERVDKYLSHGAENVYLPKGQRGKYLDFCDQMVSVFFKDPNVTLEQKASEITRLGEETMDFLKELGFSAETLQKSQAFVSKVSLAIVQLTPHSELLRAWISNAATLEHSIAITTISSLFLKHIGSVKPETHQAVGMACFLHDIGMLGLDRDAAGLDLLDPGSESEANMTESQKVEYEKHPALGAQMILKDKNVPIGIAKAIEQHHVRMNGGFPKVKGVLDLSPVAEIIGISEEFYRQIKKAQTDRSIDPIKAMTEIAHRDFSSTIALGFLNTIKVK